MSLNLSRVLYSGLILSKPAAVQNCLALRTIIRKLLWITVLKIAIWHWICERSLPQCPFHRVA